MNFLKYFSLFVLLSAIIQNYSTTVQFEKISSSGGECSLCEFVANYVEGYLAQNYTETQIETLLDKVCDLGPNSFIQTCDSFIDSEVPVIISEFENYETPEEVCTQMGFC